MSETRRNAVGQPVPHESAEAHVSGRALYTDDLWPRMHEVLHAWPVMTDVAHGHLTRLDVAPALLVPGVVRVLTAADVPGENDTGAARRDEPLFPRPASEGEPPEILFHGMPCAWVLAQSAEAAKQGAKAVVFETVALPHVVGIDAAIAAGSFHTEFDVIRRGEPEATLRSAPHQLEGALAIGGQEHFYLEMHASLAHVDENGSVFIQASTQHPTETQDVVARVLGRVASDVVVQQIRMGGGFGGKETQANPFASVAAIGAVLTGRPVRVGLDRLRDFTLSGKRHPFMGRYRAGFDESGKLLALDAELYSDGGYSLDLSSPVLNRALFHVDNAYHLAHVEVRGRVCKTHCVSHTAFRGFGGPQGMAIVEEVMDSIARTLGIAPELVRERNLYRPGDTTHYEQPVQDAERATRIWSQLCESSQLAERRAEIARWNDTHPSDKRGIAITPVKFGISFTAKWYNQAGALVHVYKDGSVQVNHGGTEMGQGLHTKMRQVAADALGVPLSCIRLMATRTDKVPNTSATAASSGSDLNGAAVKDACDLLRERLAQAAASKLGVAAESLVFADGMVEGGGKSISFEALADYAYHERVQLSATGFYRTPTIHYDAKAGRGKPFYYFAWGAAVTEVHVDGFTGMFRVARVDILHDVGASLSPLVDLGQVEGAFAQGVGWLTQEELVWDAEGRLRTGNASTYKLPSLGECPPIFNTALLPKAEQPGVVHGSKAVGEPPFMLAFSAREAIRDAVAAFASKERRGPIALSCPSTAEQVFFAIERIRERPRKVEAREASAAPAK